MITQNVIEAGPGRTIPALVELRDLDPELHWILKLDDDVSHKRVSLQLAGPPARSHLFSLPNTNAPLGLAVRLVAPPASQWDPRSLHLRRHVRRSRALFLRRERSVHPLLLFFYHLTLNNALTSDSLFHGLTGVKRSYTFGPAGGGYEDPVQ